MVDALDMSSVISGFNCISMNAAKIQEEILRKILEENGDAEYLQKYGLKGRTDEESFKRCIPIVDHNDIEPYIRRISDGDSSPVLTGKPITTLSLSSGTTLGQPKLVPFNDDLMDTTLQIYSTSYAFRNREFPLESGKALQFIYGGKRSVTKGGLAAGTATTNVFRNSRFKNGMKAIQSPCCSPDEIIFGADFQQSLYCHLLCGLVFHQEIQVVSSTFAHSIVLAFQTFEEVWEELVSDIRQGQLSTRITSPSMRTAMAKLLRPDPLLADTIHQKCTNLTNWYGLIPQLFPNAKYVYGIMTGSMEPYVKKLRHYAGSLHLCSADYGSSEGWIGVNVDPKSPPEEATFAVLPNIGYFEFIPTKNAVADSNPEPLGLTDVKINEEYEILITNLAGLYRYRLGDVVRVAGFYNSTPALKFIRRQKLLLTINIDKNTEKDLQLSVEAASKILAAEKVEVVDFSSMVDMSAGPGHYVIFWEVSGQPSDETLQECCDCLDRAFLDAGYISSRKIGSIGALELRILWEGTFLKVMNHFIGQGASVSQFKTPRCVGPNNKALRQILCSNVKNSYFSSAY